MKKTNPKNIFLLIVIFAAVVFSGCAKVNVTGEISPDFMVTYEGRAEFNMSKYSYAQQSLAQENLLKLSEYWKEAGYDSNVTLDGQTYAVYFTKQQQCQNYEDAFDALFKMMTDEYSPFSNLSYEFVPYENLSEYKISGSIDAQNFLDSEVLFNLNDDLQSQITEEMNKSDIMLNFILPNHYSFSDVNNAPETFEVKIIMDNVTDFEIAGQVYNTDIALKNSDTVNQYNYYTNLKYILIAVLTVVVILTIILLIRLRKRKVS